MAISCSYKIHHKIFKKMYKIETHSKVFAFPNALIGLWSSTRLRAFLVTLGTLEGRFDGSHYFLTTHGFHLFRNEWESWTSKAGAYDGWCIWGEEKSGCVGAVVNTDTVCLVGTTPGTHCRPWTPTTGFWEAFTVTNVPFFLWKKNENKRSYGFLI